MNTPAASPAISRSHIRTIYTIAVIGFIFTLHMVVPMYSNSSFLSGFVDESTVGYIYMVGAAVTVLGFLIGPAVIRRIGNYRTTILLTIIQIALFWGIIAAQSALGVIIFFVLQTANTALIGLCLDIFLEGYTDGQHVGGIRGMYGATLNAAWIIAPLIGSMIINGTSNYHNTYVISLAMLFPLLYLIYKNFPRFHDPHYTHPSPWQLIRHASRNTNWVRLFTANTIMQVFYAWMTVYCPLYMYKVMGFRWEEIGIILVIMLIPFPLVQYPLGKLSDGKGEKKYMIAGFFIMGFATITLSFVTMPSVALWALVLFITRIGAAAAEVMMETYFFKMESPRDAAGLGLFRMTRPISYFIAPLIAMGALALTTDQYVFAIVGVITLFALYPIARLKERN